MDMYQIMNGRHLLYLDILGFKELVQRQSASHVYEVLDKVLVEFTHRQKLIDHSFKTIYFSDTIIFYQATPQWGRWAFMDCYAIGAMAWSTLASHGIPSRGTIAFGEFNVKSTTGDTHEAFWGPALIDAYEMEKDELHHDWIGLTICPSARNAMNYMDEGIIDRFAEEGRWFEAGDGSLFLNPFLKLKGAYEDELLGEIEGDIGEWNAPDFPAEIRALMFLKSVRDGTNLKMKNLPDQVLQKYSSTYSRLSEMLGPDLIKWSIDVGNMI